MFLVASAWIEAASIARQADGSMSAFGTKQTLKTTASDAALAAWRRQMKLHVSVESNGAESPA